MKLNIDFINQMLKEFGKKPLNFSAIMGQFNSADKNRDGGISKEEFKKQLRLLLGKYSS